MSPKNLLSAALVTGSLFAAGAASAAILVTLDPTGNNGGAGTLDAGTPAFQATGFSSDLTASLVINSNAGAGVGFLETGSINVTSFGGHPSAAGSNVNSTYHIYGTFTISGTGTWVGTNFTADPGVSLTLNLIGDPGAIGPGGGAPFSLGTANIAPGPALAFAIAFGSVAPGASGTALTSFSAGLSFTPAAGTTGPGGFFNSPNPFFVDLAVGNAGGNQFNTGYSVSPAGVVTFTTPSPAGANPGTANVTFIAQIPEPGALSLAGVALLLAGIAARRKTTTKA